MINRADVHRHDVKLPAALLVNGLRLMHEKTLSQLGIFLFEKISVPLRVHLVEL